MEKKGKFDYILLETTGLADPGSMRSAKVAAFILRICIWFILVFQALAWGWYSSKVLCLLLKPHASLGAHNSDNWPDRPEGGSSIEVGWYGSWPFCTSCQTAAGWTGWGEYLPPYILSPLALMITNGQQEKYFLRGGTQTLSPRKLQPKMLQLEAAVSDMGALFGLKQKVLWGNKKKSVTFKSEILVYFIKMLVYFINRLKNVSALWYRYVFLLTG